MSAYSMLYGTCKAQLGVRGGGHRLVGAFELSLPASVGLSNALLCVHCLVAKNRQNPS